VVLSEGARWKGYEVKEYGEPDAFGHRKKFSVAEAFSDELIQRSKVETVVSDLTYDLRSGAPDFLDTLVATTFGTMAYDAITNGKHGVMASISGGRFAMVPIPDPKLGPRKVEIETMFNVERYRPAYTSKEGLPVFLTHL
jgi:6-phosphofructokinase 1